MHEHMAIQYASGSTPRYLHAVAALTCHLATISPHVHTNLPRLQPQSHCSVTTACCQYIAMCMELFCLITHQHDMLSCSAAVQLLGSSHPQQSLLCSIVLLSSAFCLTNTTHCSKFVADKMRLDWARCEEQHEMCCNHNRLS